MARGRLRRLASIPSFWLGAAGVALLIGAAVFAPVLTAHDPSYQYRDIGKSATGDPLGPGGPFILGTDKHGRDYFSRLLYGARVSLTVGIGANTIAVVFGTLVGLTAALVGTARVPIRLGRWRGRLALPVESILMRITDVVLAFPVLLLALALVGIIGRSFGLVVAVVALFLWTPVARMVYGRVVSLKEREFVEAARAIGVPPVRIALSHVFPHLVPVLLVYGALGISAAILFEATLSFLGQGVPPPAPSWGTMFQENIDYYSSDPRLTMIPGLAILVTLLSFNLLADALRTAIDPFENR